MWGKGLAGRSALKYTTKIESHNILLKMSLQDNDFDYLNIQAKILIPEETMRIKAILKFPMAANVEIIFPTPISKHLY